jgi:hypothetical protein
MDAEIHDYWRNRLDEACAQRDELCDQLRDEIQRLQTRCNELAQINSMGRAAVAMDVRDFAVANSAVTPNGVTAVPLVPLVDFLHHYSNGLVPHLPREGKRSRTWEDELPEAAEQPYQQQPPPVASGFRLNHTPTTAQLLAQRNSNVVTTPSDSSPLVRCGQQMLLSQPLLGDTVDRKRRERDEHPTGDEVTQVRPWLFSRVP